MKLIFSVIFLLGLSGCADFERREIEGSPFNDAAQCWEARQLTGVFTRENACGNSVHIAEDEDGQIWHLTSDCDAASFHELRPDDSNYQAVATAPQCSDL